MVVRRDRREHAFGQGLPSAEAENLNVEHQVEPEDGEQEAAARSQHSLGHAEI